MSTNPPIATALEMLDDKAFRARAVHEYKTITRYAGPIKDGSRLLDFGCGEGIAASSFAMRHPSSVVFGTDIQTVNASLLADRILALLQRSFPPNLDLRLVSSSALPDDICDLDLIYSWSVFEHVRRDLMVPILEMLRRRLKPGGMMFLQIEPLYFSSRGAHLYGAIPEPWSHLVHQTDLLREKLFASPGLDASKTRLWDQYTTLNRATADDIIDACILAGFRVLKKDILTSEIDPPPALLRAYSRDALITNELRLLLAP